MSNISVRTSYKTDKGKVRENNQDVGFDQTTPDAPCGAAALLVVADGMGGHAAGEVASKEALDQMVASLSEVSDGTSDVGAYLEEAVKRANSAVYEKGKDPEHQGMGTTLTAALVIDSDLYVANVGDSRCYLYSDGQLTQITDDHSYVEEQVKSGAMTPEQARTHPHRNIVTRAIGLSPEVIVDISTERLQEGDRILLCSDGLYPLVTDAEIASQVVSDDPEQICEELVAMANTNGGNDNITVAIGIVGTGSSRDTKSGVPTKTKRQIYSKVSQNQGFLRRLFKKLINR